MWLWVTGSQSNNPVDPKQTVNPRSAHGGFQSPPPRPLHSGHFLWLQEKSWHPQDIVPGTTANPRATCCLVSQPIPQWKESRHSEANSTGEACPGAPSPGILGLFCLTQCLGPRPPDPPHSPSAPPSPRYLNFYAHRPPSQGFEMQTARCQPQVSDLGSLGGV